MTSDTRQQTSADGQRLAKRVAEMVPCSRREAELYIEAGHVSVDGKVVDTPQFRVLNQRIVLAPHAKAEEVLPVTLLLHKPAGFDALDGPRLAEQLLIPAGRFKEDRATDHTLVRTLRRHLLQQICVTPLETGATGLLVYSQDFRVKRKLVEDAATVEHEVIVDVTGEVTQDAIDWLNRTPVVDGRAMIPAKVSLSSQAEKITGLRFAVKGCHPGQIAQMCQSVNLRVVAMKRIRVGRLPLAGLPVGQWRYLLPYERF
jgi:23S rRNA pseudouridine2604 synthase